MVRTEAFVGAVLVLHNREHIIIKLMHGWNTSTVTEPPHVPYHLLNEKKKKKKRKINLKAGGSENFKLFDWSIFNAKDTLDAICHGQLKTPLQARRSVLISLFNGSRNVYHLINLIKISKIKNQFRNY
jgi:hypothetical protein